MGWDLISAIKARLFHQMVNRTVVRMEPGHLIVGLVCVGESNSTPLFPTTRILAIQTAQALTMFLLSLVSLIVLQFHLSLVVSISRIPIQCFTRHKKFKRIFRVGEFRMFFQRQEKSKTSHCFLTCQIFMLVTNNFVVRCDDVATFLRSVQSVHTMIRVSSGQCSCNFRTSAYFTIRIFWNMSDLIVFSTCSFEANSTSANFSSSVRSTSAIFLVAQIRPFFCSSWANLGGVRFRPFEIGGTLGPEGWVPNIYRFVFFRHIFRPLFLSLEGFSWPCVRGSGTTEIVRLGFSGNPNGTRRPQEPHFVAGEHKKERTWAVQGGDV